MNVIFWIVLGIAALCVIYVVAIYFYSESVKKKRILYNERTRQDVEKKFFTDKNIAYKKIGDKQLLMDVYCPEGSEQLEEWPVVVMIHGDGAKSFIRDAKDWGMFTSYGQLLAASGLAAVTFNHRSSGITSGFKNINNSSEDILDLLDYVRKYSGRWQLDKNRMCIWAFSSGAVHLGLFLKKTPSYIKCIVSYYGLLDVKTFTKKNKEQLNSFYPENYLSDSTSKEMPLMIVRAGRDIRRINAGIDSFINTAETKGIKFTYLEHPQGRHSFDILNDDFHTRSIIKNTIDFIKKSVMQKKIKSVVKGGE